MQIIYDPRFINQFNTVWDYIALDSISRANSFKKELKEKIENLPYMPYKYKKSIYFHDKNIRDFIFKGYVIPYKIDKPQNALTIIGITKYKKEL
ncbi:MAG: type II toxin-antitoxin system RelE/ParE family toxin [Thiovulaceae bacterium]|nr:type II toxin-antitoxin system RelE/ParE family toxin [Sulfurimonadaceae bacterium]